jgi:uncharacterized protein (DUF983 family)
MVKNNFSHYNSELQLKLENKPVLPALLACKCPRCRTGNMFVDDNPWKLKRTMKMDQQCAVCGQDFNIEVGFYYGSSYISYALSTALSVSTLLAWWVLIGFSFQDNRFFYWLTFNCIFLIAMQPYLMRLARTGWLSFFVRYDRNWHINEPIKPERTNKQQENNW